MAVLTRSAYVGWTNRPVLRHAFQKGLKGPPVRCEVKSGGTLNDYASPPAHEAVAPPDTFAETPAPSGNVQQVAVSEQEKEVPEHTEEEPSKPAPQLKRSASGSGWERESTDFTDWDKVSVDDIGNWRFSSDGRPVPNTPFLVRGTSAPCGEPCGATVCSAVCRAA